MPIRVCDSAGMIDRPGLGTQLRHLIDVLDGDVATFQADLGLTDFRPRYTPVVRALVADGPMSIRDLAAAMQVTHSAASQTVNHMRRAGLVSLQPGADARQRIVDLTAKSRAMLPALQREWAATEAAADRLQAELAYPLQDLLTELLAALRRRSFRDRIADAALDPAPGAGRTMGGS